MTVGIETVTTYTSAAVQAAIDKVYADTGGSGGVVLLPPGGLPVTSTIVKKPKVTLQGSGKQTSVLVAQSDITVLDVIGSASANAPGGLANHIASPILSDIAIDGGNNPAWSTQPMVRFYYCHVSEIEAVVFRNKFGIATLIGAECWDDTWTECRWDGCGGVNQGLPAMLIQSADGATFPAFGSSTDATNDQRFNHCTWESFRDGALWTANPTGANSVGNLYFNDCKADQNLTALGPWFIFDKVDGVFIRDMDTASTGAGAAYLGTPYDIFTFKQSVPGLISNLKHYHNSLANDSLINFNGTVGSGNSYFHLDGVKLRQIGSVNALGTSVVKFSGTNQWFEGLDTVKYIGSSPTVIKPLFSGTLPTQKPIALRTKAGTLSISDFGTQEPGIPTGMGALLGIDTTNGRAYFLYPDGTSHYVALT